MINHLLLSGGLPVWIQLSQLEMAEEHLNRGSSVTVRGGEDNRDLHLSEVASYLFAGMVSGIIEEYDRVFLPAGRVLIELPHQGAHEQHEGVLISGGVAQGEVDSPFRIERRDH